MSVSDIHQDEIIEFLRKAGFVNIICAYKYVFLNEKEIPKKVPESIIIDLRGLLIQQYRNFEFNRYDIIVRLWAMENYYKKNSYGFEFY